MNPYCSALVGFLSGRVLGSDIEKFVMDDQEKENGSLQGSMSKWHVRLAIASTAAARCCCDLGCILSTESLFDSVHAQPCACMHITACA